MLTSSVMHSNAAALQDALHPGDDADVDSPEDLAVVDPLAGFMATDPLPRIRFLLQNRYACNTHYNTPPPLLSSAWLCRVSVSLSVSPCQCERRSWDLQRLCFQTAIHKQQLYQLTVSSPTGSQLSDRAARPDLLVLLGMTCCYTGL
eukprot:GHUV01054278.1.p1 GENE.GHUV01054278.1~~GHUV01054278.1.p1  ORF type:complete len:147 (+),score=25.12 GHUV01054278.1:247-687(+)